MGVSWRLSRSIAAALALTLCACVSACQPRADEATPLAASSGAPEKGATMLALSSPAFEEGGLIPVEYANTGVSGGQNVSIPYEWSGVPDDTRSLALVVVDVDPVARSWIHWMVTAIPPTVTSLARGASGRAMPEGAVEHPNTWGQPGYGGPQPPAGTGKHEYEARLYALDVDAPDPGTRTLSEFNASIDGHVLGSAEYSGLFGR